MPALTVLGAAGYGYLVKDNVRNASLWGTLGVVLTLGPTVLSASRGNYAPGGDLVTLYGIPSAVLLSAIIGSLRARRR